MEVTRPGHLTRTEGVLLTGLALLALALRLGYQLEMQGNVLVDHLQLDELFHDRWAQSIAGGDVTGDGVFFRAPLYPYVLGFIYAAFGRMPDLIRILQHLLGAGGVALLFVLGRTLYGTRAGVLASTLGALYAVLIFFEGRLLFDSPLTFLCLLWLTLVILYADEPVWHRYALFGLLFGLICVMRPPFLALALPLGGYIVWRYLRGKPAILRCSIALVAAFLLPVLAVTIRNAVVGRDFVLIASQGGINFYIGNNPHSDGMSSWIPEAGPVWGENRQVEYLAEQALSRPLRPSEVSSYWYHRGWEFVRTEPAAFAALLLKKLYLFWSHIEIENNLSYYWFERASVVLRLLPVGFWLVGPLGFAGAILAWKNSRSRLLLLFLVLYVLVTIAFFVTDRFRLPAIPILCIFAGFAIDRTILVIASRKWRSLTACVALIGAGVLLVDTDFTSLQPDTGVGDEQIRGSAALESGDFVKAAELFERVARLDPANSSVRINQGIVLWRLGRIPEALEALRAGLEGNPWLGSINLSHLYFTTGQMDSAWVYADRAIKARPYAQGGYVIAAKIQLARQNVGRAEDILRAGLRACGRDYVSGDYLLAGIRLLNGDITSADSIYRRVLASTARPWQPGYTVGSEEEEFGDDLSGLHARALHALGRMWAVRGRPDSSEVYYRAAATELPSRPDILGDWVVCLLRLDRLREADSVLHIVLRIDPDNPAMWYNSATLLARAGEFDAARQAVGRALALNPGFEEARQLSEALEARENRQSGK